MAAKNNTAGEAEREIVTTRVIAAPRESVFRAWSDPIHLARWWGPTGFRNTFERFELRPGGTWEYVMHAPDGADYRNRCVFVEIVPPERLVFDHLLPYHAFRVTATFAPAKGGTRVTLRMLFESAAECARDRDFIVVANEQNFDRLETELAAMANEKTYVSAKK
jgi:uncharacterized protein YndB with AHSA1/START domain